MQIAKFVQVFCYTTTCVFGGFDSLVVYKIVIKFVCMFFHQMNSIVIANGNQGPPTTSVRDEDDAVITLPQADLQYMTVIL